MNRVAFRCRACGHLHAAEHAGECPVPHACAVCGAGVRHGPDFKAIAARLIKPGLTDAERATIAQEVAAAQNNLTKTFDPDNWEILADAPAEALASYGLSPDMVARHQASGEPQSSKAIFVNVADGIGIQDKVS